MKSVNVGTVPPTGVAHGPSKGVLIAFLAFISASAYWSEPKRLGPQINRVDSTFESLYGRISPDGRQLYFTAGHYTYEEDIYVARWNPAIADWDSVTRLPIGTVNTKQRDLSPSVTADGKHLYFTSFDRQGGYGGYDIWHCAWDSVKGEWSQAQNCGPNVNSRGTEFTSFITPAGKRLCFSSTRLGDRMKLMYSDRAGDDWGPPQDCGEGVNDLHLLDPKSPWVSTDGKTMYFEAWTSMSNRDILMSDWEGVRWAQAENVGPPICLDGPADYAPSLSADGMRIYFTSTRDTRTSSSIWVSEWVEGIGESGNTSSGFCQLVLPTHFLHRVDVEYFAPAGSHSTLAVMDATGRDIVRAFPISRCGGRQRWQWSGKDGSGKDVGRGVYFILLDTASATTIRKVIRL